MAGKSSRRSCIVGRDGRRPGDPTLARSDPSRHRPADARPRALARPGARRRCWRPATSTRPPRTTSRVVGFDDPEITAAACSGLGEARYRMDDEDGAVATWEAVLELPRDAVDLSRLAQHRGRARPRRRPERRDRRLSRGRPPGARGRQGRDRQPARLAGQGDRQRPGLAPLLRQGSRRRVRSIADRTRSSRLTVVVSLTAMLSTDGRAIYDAAPARQGAAVAAGEYWRLWTVTLLHGPATLLHLLFNMYALYLAGPIVERLVRLDPIRRSSTSSARRGGSRGELRVRRAPRRRSARPGAIFGLFGILLVATRTHHPALDRQRRGTSSRQLGTDPVINIVFGIVAARLHRQLRPRRRASSPARCSGSRSCPAKVATIRSMWQAGRERPAGERVHRQPDRAARRPSSRSSGSWRSSASIGFSRWG